MFVHIDAQRSHRDGRTHFCLIFVAQDITCKCRKRDQIGDTPPLPQRYRWLFVLLSCLPAGGVRPGGLELAPVPSGVGRTSAVLAAT